MSADIATPSVAGDSPWLQRHGPRLGFGLAFAVVALAAGLAGFQRERSAWQPHARPGNTVLPQSMVAASGSLAGPAPAQARAASAAASTASGSAAPAAVAAASAPTWPVWEFKLRQPVPPRDPPLTPPSWRLVGASKSGKDWQLIILRQGKAQPDFLKTGDNLPGGYRIAQITEEDVTLVRGKDRLVLSYIGTR